MTKLIKKYQNNGIITPRFKNTEQSDAIAYTVRPQTIAIERAKREVPRIVETRNKASENRKKYPLLKNSSDEVAANYNPEAWRKNASSISQGDTKSERDVKRKLGLVVPAEEIEKRVDVANNLNSFYTNLGQPLPAFNKEAIMKDPSRGLGVINTAIDYGVNSPSMMLLQTAPTIGNGSSIVSTAKGAWNAGSNLFTKSANVAGKLALRNPGAASTVALTTLPSFTIGDRQYDGGNAGLILAGAFSPEIAKYTYKGLRLIPGLGKALPKSVTWGKVWNGTKKAMSAGNYIVPRATGALGMAYLSGKSISQEMSPEKLGEVIEPPTSDPTKIGQTMPTDSVLLDDGTYLKGITYLPD